MIDPDKEQHASVKARLCKKVSKYNTI